VDESAEGIKMNRGQWYQQASMEMLCEVEASVDGDAVNRWLIVADSS
jgi:hypothetical protein